MVGCLPHTSSRSTGFRCNLERRNAGADVLGRMSLQDSTHFWAILGMQMAAWAWSGTWLSKILQIPCSVSTEPRARGRAYASSRLDGLQCSLDNTGDNAAVVGRGSLQDSTDFRSILRIHRKGRARGREWGSSRFDDFHAVLESQMSARAWSGVWIFKIRIISLQSC